MRPARIAAGGIALRAPYMRKSVPDDVRVGLPVLLRRTSRGARLLLGGLGAAMVPGYAWERLVRQRLTPAGWDTAESPVILAGIGLAAAMAVIGLRPARS